MRLELYFLWLLLKLSGARYAPQMVPKFYAQDSAIIVDTDKQLPVSISTQHTSTYPLYRPMQSYPAYHIIKPVASAKSGTARISGNKISQEISRSSSDSVNYTPDEFPNDLLEIAQHKLGLKRLDEIPTISELGELLGTSNAEETMKYIRQLTTTEQGIALIKAYIESTDYTDSSALVNKETGYTRDGSENDNNDDDDDGNNSDDNDTVYNSALTLDKTDDLVVIPEVVQKGTIIQTLAQPPATSSQSFLQRLYSYFNIYSLWPQKQMADVVVNKSMPVPVHTADAAETSSISATSRVRLHKQQQFAPAFIPAQHVSQAYRRPLLVRPPLPYHYPIPLRPMVLPTKVASITSTAPTSTSTHVRAAQAIRTATSPTTSTRSLPTVTTTTPTASTNTQAAVPIQRINVETVTTSVPTPAPTTLTLINSPIVHLNTPKALLPHVQNLLRVATNKIPQKALEKFLQNKPKLAELAAKVSRLPISHDRGAVVDAQLLAAVQKAIEQDDDLKKLLSASETLK